MSNELANNYAHTSLQNCHNNLDLGHQKLDPELELENIQKTSPKSKDKQSTKKASIESLIDTFLNPPAPPEEPEDHISTGTLAYQRTVQQAI